MEKISDSWENDIGASVIQTNDGGYIVLCDNYTIGSNSYFFKINELDSMVIKLGKRVIMLEQIV